jgi:hypothetical protein
MSKPPVIWVTDYIDYPESGGGICDFHTTPEAAIRDIKARYGKRYKVTWEENRYGDSITLKGHFKHVTGYSIEHTGEWAIYSVEVKT